MPLKNEASAPGFEGGNLAIERQFKPQSHVESYGCFKILRGQKRSHEFCSSWHAFFPSVTRSTNE